MKGLQSECRLLGERWRHNLLGTRLADPGDDLLARRNNVVGHIVSPDVCPSDSANYIAMASVTACPPVTGVGQTVRLEARFDPAEPVNLEGQVLWFADGALIGNL